MGRKLLIRDSFLDLGNSCSCANSRVPDSLASHSVSFFSDTSISVTCFVLCRCAVAPVTDRCSGEVKLSRGYRHYTHSIQMHLTVRL